MSLQITDRLSPGLVRLAARCRDVRPALEAMGLEAVSLTKRAFTDSTLRPKAWAPKRDGTPATLRKSGALWQSIRVTSVTGYSVTWASDRRYAAIHQLGGKRMPARPYFPILDGKLTEAARVKIEAVGRAKILILLK